MDEEADCNNDVAVFAESDDGGDLGPKNRLGLFQNLSPGVLPRRLEGGDFIISETAVVPEAFNIPEIDLIPDLEVDIIVEAFRNTSSRYDQQSHDSEQRGLVNLVPFLSSSSCSASVASSTDIQHLIDITREQIRQIFLCDYNRGEWSEVDEPWEVEL